MRLILVRHGETVENAQGIIQGQLAGTLDERGRRQARRTARELGREHVDRIYSSDLARAADTAEEIARRHDHVPVVYRRELRERFFGRYQGSRAEEIDWSTVPETEVESLEALSERAAGFLEEMQKRHAGQTVVVVGHGGTCAAMIARIRNESLRDFFRQADGLANGGISIFEWRAGGRDAAGRPAGWSEVLCNSSRHLRGV